MKKKESHMSLPSVFAFFPQLLLSYFFNMGENYKRIHLRSYETVLYKQELLKYKIMRHDDLK